MLKSMSVPLSFPFAPTYCCCIPFCPGGGGNLEAASACSSWVVLGLDSARNSSSGSDDGWGFPLPTLAPGDWEGKKEEILTYTEDFKKVPRGSSPKGEGGCSCATAPTPDLPLLIYSKLKKNTRIKLKKKMETDKGWPFNP